MYVFAFLLFFILQDPSSDLDCPAFVFINKILNLTGSHCLKCLKILSIPLSAEKLPVIQLHTHTQTLMLTFVHRARPVYVYGQLVYSVGMLFMAVFRHPAAVIIFSCCAGVMYSTLFTMPYLLVAHYHASGMVSMCLDDSDSESV